MIDTLRSVADADAETFSHACSGTVVHIQFVYPFLCVTISLAAVHYRVLVDVVQDAAYWRNNAFILSIRILKIPDMRGVFCFLQGIFLFAYTTIHMNTLKQQEHCEGRKYLKHCMAIYQRHPPTLMCPGVM